RARTSLEQALGFLQSLSGPRVLRGAHDVVCVIKASGGGAGARTPLPREVARPGLEAPFQKGRASLEHRGTEWCAPANLLDPPIGTRFFLQKRVSGGNPQRRPSRAQRCKRRSTWCTIQIFQSSALKTAGGFGGKLSVPRPEFRAAF